MRFARLIVVLFLAGSLLVPSKSFAVVPALLVAFFASLTTSEVVALSASVALHVGVASIIFKNSSSTPNTPALVVNINPKAPVVDSVPAGWAAGVPGSYPIPPILQGSPVVTTTFQAAPAASSSSFCGAVQNYLTYALSTNTNLTSYTLTSCNESSFSASATSVCKPGTCSGGSTPFSLSPNGQILRTTQSTCPTGYSVFGSSCKLNEPLKVPVPNDGKKIVPRVGNTIKPDPRDTDPLPPGVTFPDDNTLKYTDPDNGETVTVNFQSSGAGTVTHTYANSSGNTNSDTFNLSAPDSSTGAVTVTGTSQTVYPGTGTGTGTTPLPPGTGGGGTGESIQFPNDYARQGEAQSAANSINTKLDNKFATLSEKLDKSNENLTKINDTLTKADGLPADLLVPPASDFENSFFKGTFTSLLAWRLPSHTPECPKAVFDYTLFGTPFHLVMDAQCTIAEQVRSLLSTMMIVVFTLSALFIVMGA